MDVSALYTNIPNNEGIEAVKNTLSKASTPTSSITVITTFLSFILNFNNFLFNGMHYLQTKGCAMGTKCAPTYANIFMGEFEEKHIYPRIKDLSTKYLRYIDDIFLLWKGTRAQLDKFIHDINEVHPSIRFTTESSEREINFLDTTVQISNSKLITKTFRKPTDRSAYLHNTSYHPNSLKNNIPFGQALRLKKISTHHDDFQKSIQQLKNAFLERGYQRNHLESQFLKTNNKTRSQLLTKTAKIRTDNIPFVTTFHKSLPNIRSAIDKHWNILKINTQLAETFKEKPFVAYRKNRNLKDLIGQTTIENNKVLRKKTQQKGKCRPCLTKTNNLCCRQIQSTSLFTSQQTKRSYTIFHNTNCKSTFVIYLLECRKCHIQYVGKTETPFNHRLNNHRNNAYRPKLDTIPACKHFNNSGHDFNKDAKFTIIEQIRNFSKPTSERRKIILQRENFWITELKTLNPLGLNQELN